MIRVAVVNGMCVRHDAISESVRGMMLALDAVGRFETQLCSYGTDFEDLAVVIVNSVGDLVMDPFYNQADVVIFHFGVYYDLFNAVLFKGRGIRIAVYHNITPERYLAAKEGPFIRRALRQRANLESADEVWCVSPFNRHDLSSYQIPDSKVSILPLYCRFDDEPDRATAKLRRNDVVKLLYVGRFVPSKGASDLLKAIQNLRSLDTPTFELTFAGNIEFSDPVYLADLHRVIEESDLGGIIKFEGRVTDDRLIELYNEAHVFVLPSYHEGFCVPILEAIRAGCVPLAYDAGNIPSLVKDLGWLVPAGDVSALQDALGSLIDQFSRGDPSSIRLPERNWTKQELRDEQQSFLRDFTYERYAENVISGVLRAVGQSPHPSSL